MLPLDKKPGLTSHQLISQVKNRIGMKIGHTGTLDKFASGLLLTLLGRYTTLASYFSNMDKEYEAQFHLGEETATLDPEGEVVRKGPVPDRASLEKAMRGFHGEIEQVPPSYSAVHVDGVRAYKRVRRGEEPALAARKVRIYDIELLDYRPPYACLRVKCSKGTYIRSIARDLGKQLGSCAYVISLRRTAQGGFRVEEAADPDQIDALHDIWEPERFLPRLTDLSCRTAAPEASKIIPFGKPITDSIFEDPPVQDGQYALLDGDKSLISIIERQGGHYRYRRVYLNT